ncbi:MAG: hypothetical protein JWM11_4127 [Planctomycetaceae bacterium]|nr:hypothetical protein [Planctomycetaceae bacterium]
MNEIAPADQADINAPIGRATRRELGKVFRKDCPRASHSEVVLGQGPRDPVSLIEISNGDRVEHLLPVRFGRMSDSAFAFFRGAAIVQAHDLKGTPSSGIIVQCCGDCHLMNFGGFATPERNHVFDINDFDETFPAPFEWDLKRLAASFAIAARWLEFEPADCRTAAQTVVTAYHENINRYADMHALDVWYAQITSEALLEQFEKDEEFHKRLKKAMEKAAQNTSERVFHKLTAEENGRVRIVDQPPLLFHDDSSQLDLKSELVPFFESYRDTLLADRQNLYDRFRLTDFAYKVVGVGSVGTRCYIALFMADDDDPLFLQVKQARASVLEGLAGPPRWASNGERVITGQRLMQSASDIFLGWSREANGRDFYVRQLRDMKFSPDLTGFTPSLLSSYASMCGHVLARAHSKGGDAATIAGYLGDGTSFDEAIAQYSVSYADQVEQDFTAFQSSIRAGRLPVDTMPAEIEQAIR